MLKVIIGITICLLLALLVTACGSASEINTDEPSQAEEINTSEDEAQDNQTTEIDGEIFETDNFSLAVPDGWEMMEVEGGVQVYKMSGEIVEVHFRGSGQSNDHAQQQTAAVAEQYGGSGPEEVAFLGNTFWMTSFTAADVPQASYLRMEDGVMVSVKIAGENFANNEEIQQILQSITFK